MGQTDRRTPDRYIGFKNFFHSYVTREAACYFECELFCIVFLRSKRVIIGVKITGAVSGEDVHGASNLRCGR